MASLSVLIHDFALAPYDNQNGLAWAASFVLLFFILSVNIFARVVSSITNKTKRI